MMRRPDGGTKRVCGSSSSQREHMQKGALQKNIHKNRTLANEQKATRVGHHNLVLDMEGESNEIFPWRSQIRYKEDASYW